MLSSGTINIFLSGTYEWLFFNILAVVCFAVFVVLAINLRNRFVIVVGGMVCAATLMLQVLSPIGVSTDYYRYLWQGRISNAGLNNYSLVPWDEGIENANEELFERMDWRDAKSVYPPVAEQYFRIPAGIFDSNILQNTDFQTRLNMSRLPSLLLFILSGFLLYMITRSKVVAFVWLALPFLQFELVNSAHIDILSITLLLGALLALKSKRLSAHMLAGSLIAAAGMVKLVPLVLIIPVASYLIVNFSIKRALAVTAAFTAVIALNITPYINDGFALTKRTFFWLSGGEFSTGNPLYEIASRISNDYGAPLLKALAIVIGTLLIIRIHKKVVDKQFTFNEMLKFCLLLTLLPFIASPIVLPWYWITPFVFILILVASKYKKLNISHMLILVFGAALLLAQYVDRAVFVSLEIRKFLQTTISFLFCVAFLIFLKKLLSGHTEKI